MRKRNYRRKRTKEEIELDLKEQCKTCPECNIRKPFSEYHKNSGTADKIHNICRVCCQKQTQAYRDTLDHRERGLKDRYGLTKEDYNNKLTQQGRCCAVCGTTDPKSYHGYFMVDHCHATGKVRALLCHNCNSGLGHFKDNTEFLQKAIEYLNAHRT